MSRRDIDIDFRTERETRWVGGGLGFNASVGDEDDARRRVSLEDTIE
jgi:hypothetical protein